MKVDLIIIIPQWITKRIIQILQNCYCNVSHWWSRYLVCWNNCVYSLWRLKRISSWMPGKSLKVWIGRFADEPVSLEFFLTKRPMSDWSSHTWWSVRRVGLSSEHVQTGIYWHNSTSGSLIPYYRKPFCELSLTRFIRKWALDKYGYKN